MSRRPLAAASLETFFLSKVLELFALDRTRNGPDSRPSKTHHQGFLTAYDIARKPAQSVGYHRRQQLFGFTNQRADDGLMLSS